MLPGLVMVPALVMLRFASGNLLLNDNINVGTGTVTNSGASLKLVNPISITGNYSQTGGGLDIVATNAGSSYGYLSVSGNASVINTTITISGTGLTAGETFTIARSSISAVPFSGDHVSITGTNGLTGAITDIGDNLVVTLSGGGGGGSTNYQQTGSTAGSAGGAIGSTLDQISNSTGAAATAFQNTVLPAINALPAAQKAQAIKQLAPTQNAPSSQMSSNAATAVLGAVEQHQQTAMSGDANVTGKAAGSNTHDDALWGQMLGGGSVRGSTADVDGSRTTDFGLATGFDHRFSDNAMGGLAFSWLRGISKGSDGASGSSSNLDSYQLTAYGTYRQGAAFFDGQMGGGYNRFHQKC